MGTWICSKCGKKWEDDEEDCNRYNGKPVCSDCYYESLGEAIEKHPIGLPRATRTGRFPCDKPNLSNSSKE